MEKRLYMGPRYAQIPRGSVVKLIGKLDNKGIIEYEGKKYSCPLRILWRIKD